MAGTIGSNPISSAKNWGLAEWFKATNHNFYFAHVVELADTLDLESGVRKDVKVRDLS